MSATPEQLQSIMTLIEGFDLYVEAAKAYRDKLIAEGFSSAAADLMAVDFHRVIVAGTL